MKKKFILEDLGCANCALKMEKAISKLPNVISAKINFSLSKLTLEIEGDDFTEVLKQAQKEIKKIERDVCIIE